MLYAHRIINLSYNDYHSTINEILCVAANKKVSYRKADRAVAFV